MRELEFIEPSVYISFTNELETLYISTLKNLKLTEHEKLIVSGVLLGISHYMGIEFFFTKNLQDKEDFLVNIKKLMVNGI